MSLTFQTSTNDFAYTYLQLGATIPEKNQIGNRSAKNPGV